LASAVRAKIPTLVGGDDTVMSDPIRILLILDAFAGVGVDTWSGAMPAPPASEHILRLTQYGASRIEQNAVPAWSDLGAVVEKLADAALALMQTVAESVELYIGGQAPLPLFVHLGFRLSKFSGRQLFLGRGASGGSPTVFDLGGASAAGAVFTHITALPSKAAFGTGTVAAYIDTAGRLPVEDRIEKALADTGQGSLALLEMRSESPITLTPETAPAAAEQITEFFSRVPSLYPKTESLALFIAGPTLLAFLVGRAMNPSLTPRTLLMNFSQESYTFVYALPFIGLPTTSFDRSTEGVNRRRVTREKLVSGIEELRKDLAVEDISIDAPLVSMDRAKALAAQLSGLRFSESDTDEFSLSLAQGVLSFGTGLLEALRGLDDTRLRDLAKLFVLHELVHDAQALRTTNFRGVGRAAVALEQVDYLADAFAIRTALHVEVRRGGSRAAEPTAVCEAAIRLVDAVVSGIEAFDQIEHGARVDRLTERRMRRYLIWHLQLARARTTSRLEDVDAMLSEPLTVEMAPLLGRIDPRRHEKIVTQATSETELFIALGGRLVRIRESHEVDPSSVLEALRSYGRQPIEKVMNYVVEEHRAAVAPWRP